MNEIGNVLAKRLGLIGQLDREDREALASVRGKIRSVAGRQDVLKHGDHPTESVVVLTGLLYRYKITPDGRRQIHSFYLANETPSLEAIPLEIMDNNLAPVVDSTLGFIEHCEIERVIEDRPNLRKLIWRETLVQAAAFREWLTRNSQLPAHAAMAHLFVEMMMRAQALGIARGNSLDLPITQNDLADALGLSPVHVNRTLAALRGLGVEFRNGVLTIENLPELEELAGFDPTYLHLHGEASS